MSRRRCDRRSPGSPRWTTDGTRAGMRAARGALICRSSHRLSESTPSAAIVCKRRAEKETMDRLNGRSCSRCRFQVERNNPQRLTRHPTRDPSLCGRDLVGGVQRRQGATAEGAHPAERNGLDGGCSVPTGRCAGYLFLIAWVARKLTHDETEGKRKRRPKVQARLARRNSRNGAPLYLCDGPRVEARVGHTRLIPSEVGLRLEQPQSGRR